MNKRLGFFAALALLFVVAFASMQFLPTEHADMDVDNSNAQEASSNISATANLPHRLPGFEQTQLFVGEEAIEMLSRLHGGVEIDVADAYEAVYEGEAGAFRIWYSKSPTVEEGQYLFDVMDEMMPASQAFTNRTEIEIDGNTYIYVFGMGMDNYYWVDGAANYWIAVTAEDTKEVLQLVIDNF